MRAEVQLPQHLRPSDGRFGSGPSKVRPESVRALAKVAESYLGTSHRRAGVRDVVGRVREGLASLYVLPDDYEVVLGVGGATAFWDAMAYGLIEHKSRHPVFGEFSGKCARAAAAPHLATPDVVESEPGTHPVVHASDDIDLYALTQNETSTGVAMPVQRPAPGAFVAVDATSAAGGMRADPAEFDVYYFSPQKCFASEGGLWIALVSATAVARIERIAGSGRYIPAFLDLEIAVDNARKNQTYNTPALATLFLLADQMDWFLDNGGLDWAVSRSAESSASLYAWAEGAPYAAPFVADHDMRSPVVVTVDIDDSVDASEVSGILRANGVIDIDPYRKLGRNQLRIATYPAIEPEDVRVLARAIDYVVDALASARA